MLKHQCVPEAEMNIANVEFYGFIQLFDDNLVAYIYHVRISQQDPLSVCTAIHAKIMSSQV